MRTLFRRAAIAVAVTIPVVAVTAPAWAAFPDQGRRVLYVRVPQTATPSIVRGGSGPDLFSIRGNGDARERVTDSPMVDELGGYYSPNGNRIVYMGVSGQGYRVYTAQADGTHRNALTDNPVSLTPNWSRNGSRIVYVKYTGVTRPASLGLDDPFGGNRRGSNGHLMIMDADGTGKHSILNGQVYAPGWSPTDNVIAFTAPTKGGFGIWHVQPNGDGLTPVVDGPGTELFADWSPNGRRMLYVSEASTTGPAPSTQIWTVRANGTDPQLVATDSASVNLLPRYSNDGERVFYVKDNGGNLELYSVRSDGSGGKLRLTHSAATEFLTLILG
jgi:Tol biopolymer transport system component